MQCVKKREQEKTKMNKRNVCYGKYSVKQHLIKNFIPFERILTQNIIDSVT